MVVRSASSFVALQLQMPSDGLSHGLQAGRLTPGRSSHRPGRNLSMALRGLNVYPRNVKLDSGMILSTIDVLAYTMRVLLDAVLSPTVGSVRQFAENELRLRLAFAVNDPIVGVTQNRTLGKIANPPKVKACRTQLRLRASRRASRAAPSVNDRHFGRERTGTHPTALSSRAITAIAEDGPCFNRSRIPCLGMISPLRMRLLFLLPKCEFDLQYVIECRDPPPYARYAQGGPPLAQLRASLAEVLPLRGRKFDVTSARFASRTTRCSSNRFVLGSSLLVVPGRDPCV